MQISACSPPCFFIPTIKKIPASLNMPSTFSCPHAPAGHTARASPSGGICCGCPSASHRQPKSDDRSLLRSCCCHTGTALSFSLHPAVNPHDTRRKLIAYWNFNPSVKLGGNGSADEDSDCIWLISLGNKADKNTHIAISCNADLSMWTSCL